jgi:hypothetical protein
MQPGGMSCTLLGPGFSPSPSLKGPVAASQEPRSRSACGPSPQSGRLRPEVADSLPSLGGEQSSAFMIFQFDEIVNLPSGSGCCVTEGGHGSRRRPSGAFDTQP